MRPQAASNILRVTSEPHSENEIGVTMRSLGRSKASACAPSLVLRPVCSRWARTHRQPVRKSTSSSRQ